MFDLLLKSFTRIYKSYLGLKAIIEMPRKNSCAKVSLGIICLNTNVGYFEY
jgi:hypothetical protein